MCCSWAPLWVHASGLAWANAGMSVQDFMVVADQLPPAAVEAILTRSSVQDAIASPKRRRLSWLNSSLRQVLKGETESICRLDLVPRYFRFSDPFSQSEAAWRNEYLRELHLTGHEICETRIVLEPQGYDPSNESWQAIEKTILEEARRQRDEIRQQYVSAGFITEDTQPELRRDVRWLFQRIALKEPPRQIAIEADYGQATVEKAIGSLAKKLGIRLPRNRGPRVRR